MKTGRWLETRKPLPRHCQPRKRVSLFAYLITKTITLRGRFFKPCFAKEESESQRNHYSRNLRKSLSSLSVWHRDSWRAKCQCFFLLKVSLEDIQWPRSQIVLIILIAPKLASHRQMGHFSPPLTQLSPLPNVKGQAWTSVLQTSSSQRERAKG